MLRFFRSSNSIVILAILLIGGLAWVHVLFGESETIPSDQYGSFAYRMFYNWLIDTTVLNAWISLVLFLLTAILLIYVNSQLRLIDKISYLPALCYIMLIGGIPETHVFNPAIIASILLIAGFIFLVKSFDSERLSYEYLIVPIFISTAMFFYQYMYVYMLVVWLAIALWRPGYWREWVFSILGFALPLFFAFSWFFLVEDDYTRLGDFFSGMFTVQRIMPSLSIHTICFSALYVVLAIIAFGYMLRYLSSRKIIIRNGYYILVLIAVITVGLILVIPDTFPFIWYILAFPMSFIMSYYLAAIKSERLGEILLLLFFGSVIAAQAIYLSIV